MEMGKFAMSTYESIVGYIYILHYKSRSATSCNYNSPPSGWWQW